MVVAYDKLVVEIEAKVDKFNKDCKQLQNLFLGMGLSFLFTGMSIERFFQSLITSLLGTFLAVEGELGPVNEKVNELKASILFAAWSIFNAFQQSGAFDMIINSIQSLVDWFNGLSDTTKTVIAWFILFGFIVGMVMMIAGGAILFLLGPLAMLQYLGVATASTIGTAFMALLPVFALLATAIWILILMNKMGGFWEFCLSFVRGVLRIFFILVAGLGGMFAELVNMVYFLWNMVVEAFEWGLNQVVEFINKLIDVYNNSPASKLFGQLERINSISLDGAKAEVKSFGKAFEDTYSNVLGSYLDWEKNGPLSPKNGYWGGEGNVVPGGAGGVDLSSQIASANASTSALMSQNASNAPVINFNQNIEGSVLTESDLITKMISGLNDKFSFNQGSSQGG